MKSENEHTGGNRDEKWFPRCPQCARGTPILAPANQYTHLIPGKIEVYCPECGWRDKLEGNLEKIYVRM